MTKVLYIEHDEDNLYMLKMRLERAGNFEVLAAEDSDKGCKLALTERPDVILMDLEMPVVDRWEPVRLLKNDPQTRALPTRGRLHRLRVSLSFSASHHHRRAHHTNGRPRCRFAAISRTTKVSKTIATYPRLSQAPCANRRHS